MGAGLLLGLLALAAPGPVTAREPAPLQEGQPSTATLLHYNARLALREGRAEEAVKLWLLRNALVARTGRVAPGDADQRAVTWAALGALGLCPEGLQRDADGPGLWPLATHNWLVDRLGRKPRGNRGAPFEAFELDRQQRTVAVHDVLDAEELQGLRLSRGRCGAALPLLVAIDEPPWTRLDDELVAARLLLHLLDRAEATLDPDRVRGRAAVAARRFDLHLVLAAAAARQARREAEQRAKRGRKQGLSEAALAALQEQAPTSTLPPDAESLRVLDAALRWPVAEWRALSRERRLFLYDQARLQAGGADAELDLLALRLLDAAVADGDGREAAAWIGRVQAAGDPPWERIWGGARGQALINLPAEAGLGERATLALHRGVHALQRGEPVEALRLLAFARSHATESAAADPVATLSRRWLHHAAGQHRLDGELLRLLQPLLSRADLLDLLEALAWRAALVGDTASLQASVQALPPRVALERRARLLTPLAGGDTAAFLRGLDAATAQAPGEAQRFIDLLIQRIEAEDLSVRARNRPVIEGLVLRLQRQASAPGAGRRIQATRERAEALLRGLDGMEGAPGAPGELYAGTVRLAPADPLPWPFQATAVPAPSAFTPLSLVPVEWRDADGALVLGWSIRG